jgi:hypothetical protein
VTVVGVPSQTYTTQHRPGVLAWLGGRFRLEERISVAERISGACGASWEASGLSLWKATDALLDRPVTIYLLPAGQPVPDRVAEAARAAAKVSDPRLATIYDTDFGLDCPYIVAEWAQGTHLEDLVQSGLPAPALAAAMIADAADALAVAHQAGRPHLRLTPRSLRWDTRTGLKITGLGLDAALCDPDPDPDFSLDAADANPLAADTQALGRMLYALLTGFWPGQDVTTLPSAPRHKGRMCTPRQVRAGVPAILDAITYQALRGQAPDAPARNRQPLTPAGLALALHGVQRPSVQLGPPSGRAAYDSAADDSAALEPVSPAGSGGRPRARHARTREGIRYRSTLLRPAV